MREIRTSGLMSGDGKRGGAGAPVLAPILDSTGILRRASARTPTWQPERSLYRPQYTSDDGCTFNRQGYRSASEEDPDAGAGSRRSHSLREPRTRLAELSVARAGRGARRLQSVARTDQIPGHRRLQPE